MPKTARSPFRTDMTNPAIDSESAFLRFFAELADEMGMDEVAEELLELAGGDGAE